MLSTNVGNSAFQSADRSAHAVLLLRARARCAPPCDHLTFSSLISFTHPHSPSVHQSNAECSRESVSSITVHECFCVRAVLFRTCERKVQSARGINIILIASARIESLASLARVCVCVCARFLIVYTCACFVFPCTLLAQHNSVHNLFVTIAQSYSIRTVCVFVYSVCESVCVRARVICPRLVRRIVLYMCGRCALTSKTKPRI